MSRFLPFRIPGQCIDCAGEIWGAGSETWRCVSCNDAMNAIRSKVLAVVNRAIKAGDIPPAKDLPCVDCEQTAHDYDHRDYLRPLDIVPVCRRCNQRRGPANWRTEAQQPAQSPECR